MWRKLLILPGVLAYTLLLYWMFTLAFPFLVDGIERVRSTINDARGKSGLIFVESPEVYTRQRLVNDRYRQDAWLRGKLDEIDANGSSFIDQRVSRILETNANINLNAAPGGTAAAPDAAATPNQVTINIPETDEIPFGAKFELQSAARDKIRQLILENSLDDRHDLSGNTVFGLKFDTAVLPGTKATLSPTVIVRMSSNPLEFLTRPPAELAQHFGRVYDPEKETRMAEQDRADLNILDRLDTHFDSWRDSVEQRLNEHKGDEAVLCQRPREEIAIELNRPLCNQNGTLSAAGKWGLRQAFGETAAVDESLYFVLRMPRREITLGDSYLSLMEDEASGYCLLQTTNDNDPTVAEFLESRIGIANRFQLPDPWGRMFEVRVTARPDSAPEICGASVDLTLDGLEVPLVFVNQALAPEDEQIFLGSGWRPVDCQTDRCLSGTSSVWAQFREESREARDAVGAALDTPTLNALTDMAANVTQDDEAPAQLCFLNFAPNEPWFFIGSTAPDEWESRCFSGEALYFRLGAFSFLKRMTQVESYTYAAFPRGDVSGVVSETGERQALTGGLSGLPNLGAALSFGLQEQNRSVEARPSLINFASGEGRRGDLEDASKIFDFGWSIVKEGIKKPMIASQLVLVSVPAYLDELELEIWKGFLDIDRVPLNRETYNTATLDERISALMPSFEKRTVTLKLPPDYPALDGVVFSTSLVSGPRIKTSRLQICYGVRESGDLTIAISGERLWRSTVVTLDGIKANRIEVMPDMRGILAHFEGLPVAIGDDPARVKRLLEVWTSEGRDKQSVRIAHNPRVDACVLEDD
ncbi:hypothetical protein AB0T83_16795 [Fluviibacterium sp. DFM31]|uniref:Uncharacterized protein n=1 Tax=Meridianimarinicoccus marinus TaxID=3231483 RepID=A0ABV3LBH1_9RHOB